MRVLFARAADAPERLVATARILFDGDPGPFWNLALTGIEIWRPREGDLEVLLPRRTGSPDEEDLRLIESASGDPVHLDTLRTWILREFTRDQLLRKAA